jgi:hypothetical protein
MRVTKTQAVLYLLQLFLKNGVVKKEDFLATIQVSEVSFRRYINELRCYFVNFDLYDEIIYDPSDGAYHLKTP